MTLLELMLVLALLVVMGALVLPSLQGPFENQKLRKAGEVVRVQWNKARIQAMKTGQIQMFLYEAEQGTFRIQPYYTEQDFLEADAQHSVMMSGGMNNPVGGMPVSGTSSMSTSASQSEEAAPRTLPEGVIFASSDVQADLRSMQIQQEVQGGQMANTQDLPPLLFYPDGTTSDARLVLTNERRLLFVVVSLRSLTGIAKVSELVTEDEIQQVP